ncbi:MAG: hypothetical protein KME18_16785 [Phormidium tanganyikae FI6-MK23]|nr:hypothetical protein [Phormidium tanganyikae FI6-MK23]
MKKVFKLRRKESASKNSTAWIEIDNAFREINERATALSPEEIKAQGVKFRVPDFQRDVSIDNQGDVSIDNESEVFIDQMGISFTISSKSFVGILLTFFLISSWRSMSWLSSELCFKTLPEEYQAHYLDRRNKMIEAGQSRHAIHFKLLCFWFVAAIWTPIVSKMQQLIPPIRISN